MAHAFRIVNVFTIEGDRFSGNPLCVFEDARGLSDADMQNLARQMNLSETTFVLPASSPDTTARVRIFTPGFEMPFAGHPTLGTAHVVRSLARSGERPTPSAADEVVFEMLAGHVAVTAVGDTWTLRAARPPVTRKVEATKAELASMLSLPTEAISGEPLWVSTGVEQLVIPVGSIDHVRTAAPVPELIARWGFSETREEAMAYVWAHDRSRPEGNTVRVRFFFTANGAVLEDPATGSACANLGGYLIATNAPLPVQWTLWQGDAVQRPSRLDLRVEADRAIYVTGSVIELGRGSVSV